MIECRYNCKHYDWSVGACNGECGIEKHFSLGYQQGRADAIDEYLSILKKELEFYDKHKELIVKLAEQLKEQTE